MGRRSDHTREELEAMIVDAAHRHMAEVGFAQFSARQVARTIGYSVGTLYNVIGGHDLLISAVNGVTLDRWSDALNLRLSRLKPDEDRIAGLVQGYFDFASAHPKAWAAVYEHHLPPGQLMPALYLEKLERLLAIVTCEVEREIEGGPEGRAAALAHSLIACVHGHCVYALNGAFALMGGDAPAADAYARVREAIEAERRRQAALPARPPAQPRPMGLDLDEPVPGGGPG